MRMLTITHDQNILFKGKIKENEFKTINMLYINLISTEMGTDLRLHTCKCPYSAKCPIY